MNRLHLTLVGMAVTLLAGCAQKQEESLKFITPVPFSQVQIQDGFWSPRLQAHKDVTLAVCIDQIENQTDRIRNYENAAKGRGQHSGIFFDDSDVYKALEGMAYSLQNHPDPVLEAKCDEWIDKFAAAQQPDGYINTFYTLTGLENRWKNMDRHEMYCAGHMIEAGVAYYQVTGKRKLLDVCIRMADHMMSVFGPGKRHWVPGHEEIELALVKLYQTTGEKKYLDFADWLLDERGHGYGSYGDERVWPTHYYQDEVPVREMAEISGHAVRSMYLYCGMADVASYTGDQGYRDALDRVWDDVVYRNMYITGGIGQSAHNEGFTDDYSLPNLTAYCETCASVGMVLWNWRMGQFTGDGKYADVLERALYNGALAGISLSGDRFFYVNPLESLGNHHRQAWFGCACCPSQICRFLPSIGNYVYGVSDKAIWVNLYMGSKADIGKGITLTQETAYPWEGAVTLTLGLERRLRKELRLRIPAWCKTYTLTVNGQAVEAPVEKGYAVLEGLWKDGDRIQLNLDMPVEVVAADPRVKEDIGLRAIQRGPVVYCLEEADNPGDFDKLTLSADAELVTETLPGKLGGIVEISARTPEAVLTYIPYYAWDNREAGKMKVWVPYQQEKQAYVFTYFDNSRQNAGLFVAYSYDGYNWTAVNGGEPIMKPLVGKEGIMRDPSVCQGPDGTFHLVWTVSWNAQSIGYASSKDLIHWSEQKIIPVMEHLPATRNTWAPELFYEASEDLFYIFWASTVPGHPDVSTDGSISEDQYNHRIYCTTTKDFETFSPTRLYFNPSFNVIDACVLRIPQTGELLMALKNENLNPPEKNIRLSRSRAMADGFPTEVSAPISGEGWAEGPTLIPIGDDILVYFDQFRKHRYGAALSHDGGYTWEDATERISVPAGMSHGTAIAVPERYVKALAGCSVPQEAKKGPLVKGILCGHMHRFFEERFSPTAIQYTVGATYNGDAQVVHFK